VKNDEEWRNFCQATGNPLWADDERFSDRYSRLLNQDALDKLVSQWTANYTPREVTEILQKAGVAAAPFLISREQYDDPHFNERGLFVKVDHPKSGTETFYGIPLKLGDTPGAVRSSGPMLGQHNEYVFKGLMGLSDDEFNRLVEEKVIY
jgi:crotonobetainyl-CoA:carnitine CoA-transferase CaiB-like acyl-CoA transferase